MVQKRRDIEILCKNTDYKSLYNECDLNTYEYFKLGLEVHGETCPLPPKEIHSEDQDVIESIDKAEEEEQNQQSLDIQTLQNTLKNFQDHDELVSNYVSRYEELIENMNQVVQFHGDKIQKSPIKTIETTDMMKDIKSQIEELRI